MAWPIVDDRPAAQQVFQRRSSRIWTCDRVLHRSARRFTSFDAGKPLAQHASVSSAEATCRFFAVYVGPTPRRRQNLLRSGPPFAHVQTFHWRLPIPPLGSFTTCLIRQSCRECARQAHFFYRTPHDRVFWIEIRPISAPFLCSKFIAYRTLRY